MGGSNTSSPEKTKTTNLLTLAENRINLHFRLSKINFSNTTRTIKRKQYTLQDVSQLSSWETSNFKSWWHYLHDALQRSGSNWISPKGRASLPHCDWPCYTLREAEDVRPLYTGHLSFGPFEVLTTTIPPLLPSSARKHPLTIREDKRPRSPSSHQPGRPLDHVAGSSEEIWTNRRVHFLSTWRECEIVAGWKVG